MKIVSRSTVWRDGRFVASLIKLASTNARFELANCSWSYRRTLAESSSNTASCAGEGFLIRTAPHGRMGELQPAAGQHLSEVARIVGWSDIRANSLPRLRRDSRGRGAQQDSRRAGWRLGCSIRWRWWRWGDEFVRIDRIDSRWPIGATRIARD